VPAEPERTRAGSSWRPATSTRVHPATARRVSAGGRRRSSVGTVGGYRWPVHPSVQRVADALARAGARGEVRELDDSTRTAADAAAALGCAVGAIANSLVFVADGEPVLVLTSGAHRVDTAHLAGAMGWSSLRRATADEVRAATGQPIGGVAPLGHRSALTVLIDADLRAFPTIWAAAGTPHSIFPTDFDELRRVAAAREVRVEAPAAAGGSSPA